MSVYLPAKRPLSVTLILWGVFLFGVWNVSKAVLLIQSRSLFLAHGVQPDSLWQAGGAMIWAGLFWAAAWALWRKRPSTQFLIPLLLLLYGLYTIAIRLIFSPLPFAANGGLTIIVFFAVVIIFTFLALQRADKRYYFVERRE
jgi:hypothetical protein